MLAAALVGAALVSCTPSEPDEGALLGPDGLAVYADGSYRASFSHTDTDGWEPFLELNVRAGLITRVCFGAVDADGRRISDAEDYRENLRLETGVNLMALVAELESQLLEAQEMRLEIPGMAIDQSVGWSVSFVLLADAALNLARAGEVASVTLPTIGPYVGYDEPDELGWVGRVSLNYDATGVAAASFEERRSGPDGEVVKARDPEASRAYERVIGLTPAGVASELTRRFVEQATAEGEGGQITADAVSGATGTTERFLKLAVNVMTQRVAVPIPSKICVR